MNLSAFIPYLGTILATIIALGMWQYQLITKRRYEVVERALTAVDDAVQALHFTPPWSIRGAPRCHSVGRFLTRHR
jgi:hypothetical protein